jgi:hypothetical protein
VSAFDDAAAEWWDTCYRAARAAQVLNSLLNLFTCFNGIKVQILTPQHAGTQFTSFTGTKVQMLTQVLNLRALLEQWYKY